MHAVSSQTCSPSLNTGACMLSDEIGDVSVGIYTFMEEADGMIH